LRLAETYDFGITASRSPFSLFPFSFFFLSLPNFVPNRSTVLETQMATKMLPFAVGAIGLCYAEQLLSSGIIAK
jgi:hypothetical protein